MQLDHQLRRAGFVRLQKANVFLRRASFGIEALIEAPVEDRGNEEAEKQQ